MRPASGWVGQRLWLAIALSVWAAGLADPARAQLSASASLQSDYRFRGVSLSDGRPALSLNLAYDHPSGLYFGKSAIGTVVPSEGAQLLGHVEYLGYAPRHDGGLSWDIGVNNENLSVYSNREYPLRYTEFYAGLIGDQISAHVYFSPNYLRPGNDTLYADVDGAFPLGRQWRLFGHAGVWTPLSASGGAGNGRERYDLRAGVARQFSNWEVQLALTAAAPLPTYAPAPSQPAVTAAISYFF